MRIKFCFVAKCHPYFVVAGTLTMYMHGEGTKKIFRFCFCRVADIAFESWWSSCWKSKRQEHNAVKTFIERAVSVQRSVLQWEQRILSSSSLTFIWIGLSVHWEQEFFWCYSVRQSPDLSIHMCSAVQEGKKLKKPVHCLSERWCWRCHHSWTCLAVFYQSLSFLFEMILQTTHTNKNLSQS